VLFNLKWNSKSDGALALKVLALVAHFPWIPTIINKVTSKKFGLTWKHCPLCGEEFGGLDYRRCGLVFRTENNASGTYTVGLQTCPKCAKKKRNEGFKGTKRSNS